MSRNVVLVTVDSLRADHCGFLADEGPGGEHDLTPMLDSLAEESLVFERAFAPGPRTPSSMPAIFTGEFYRPTDQGVYSNWEEKSTRWQARRRRIASHLGRFRSVAERMQDRGYETAGVTANPWTTEDTNFDEGFDEFHAVEGADASERPWYSSLTDKIGDTMGIDWGDVLLTWTDFYDTVQAARDSLAEPYFLWVFLMDPHQPYIAPRRYRKETTVLGMLYGNGRYNYAHGYTEELPSHLDRQLRRAYRDTVRSVDGFIEQYREDFAADDPVTVFHADHGEAFQEHGTFGHRPQLYRENVHVPLLVHGSNSVDQVKEPVSLRCVPDLLTAIATGELIKPEAFTRKFVLSKTEESERVGVRGSSWAYQTDTEEWEYIYAGGQEELYKVTKDPDEQANVAIEYPKVRNSFLNIVRHRQSEQVRLSKIIADSSREKL
ncbi:sulfatase [Halostella sp. JP-L12]|uniref:sulfatase n=1 Tax=Halostella TaxID=1843185 RepID=UPI000EF7D8FF|nr:MULTISPECIES: sulfatase [Halostella]NHN46527.1 sulfatase [Halostella sp. JP-L12]